MCCVSNSYPPSSRRLWLSFNLHQHNYQLHTCLHQTTFDTTTDLQNLEIITFKGYLLCFFPPSLQCFILVLEHVNVKRVDVLTNRNSSLPQKKVPETPCSSPAFYSVTLWHHTMPLCHTFLSSLASKSWFSAAALLLFVVLAQVSVRFIMTNFYTNVW